MSLHVEKCHHRPFVWQWPSGGWIAECRACGWLNPKETRSTQHRAFIAALAHAEESLR